MLDGNSDGGAPRACLTKMARRRSADDCRTIHCLECLISGNLMGIALVHCEPSTVRLQNEKENSLVFRNFANNVSNYKFVHDDFKQRQAFYSLPFLSTCDILLRSHLRGACSCWHYSLRCFHPLQTDKGSETFILAIIQILLSIVAVIYLTDLGLLISLHFMQVIV